MSSHLHCDGQELPIIATDVRFDESLELVGTGHGSVCKLLIGLRPIVPACTRVGRRDRPVKRRCSVASSWPLRLEFWGVRSAALMRTSDPGSYAESDPALAGDDHEPSRLRTYIYVVRVPRPCPLEHPPRLSLLAPAAASTPSLPHRRYRHIPPSPTPHPAMRHKVQVELIGLLARQVIAPLRPVKEGLGEAPARAWLRRFEAQA